MQNTEVKELGLNIRTSRIERGLSQEELANLAGIDRGQLSRIEKGVLNGVAYQTISKIYAALGMTLVAKKGEMKMKELHPFVKWAGGKTQLLEIISSHLPESFGHYYEPFIGGGALLLKIHPESFSINDMNDELLSVYRCLCDEESFSHLKEELERHESLHSDEYYYQIRAMDHDPGFSELPIWVRAGRMIYLNKACFNGLYRVNSKGFFNVPSGQKKAVNCFDRDNLEALHSYFMAANPTITQGDFEEAVQNARPGDFVYFDPPYDTWEDKESFTSYAKDEFGKEAQARLARCFRALAERGVYVMLSNHNTKYINELYAGFHINVVQARRNINSDAKGRGKVEEVLITSYEE